MERLTDTSEVRLRTTNGDLLLSLPGAAAAAVVAQTATGEIEVEGLTFEDRNLDPSGTGARFSGQLGERGADVQLQTENGSVLLREGAVPTLAALGTFPREVAQVDPAPDTLRSAALLDGLTPDTLYTAADSALTPADSLAIPTAEDVDTTAVGVLPLAAALGHGRYGGRAPRHGRRDVRHGRHPARRHRCRPRRRRSPRHHHGRVRHDVRRRHAGHGRR